MRKFEPNEDTLLEETNRFIDQIINVPETKIVTVTSQEGSAVFDIDKTGNIGYIPAHPTQFAKEITYCLSFGSSLVLRQFTKDTTAMRNKGKIIRIPIKNIYGARIGNGYWEWISSEEMRIAYCTDSKTDRPLSPEEGVNYSDFNFE